MKYYLDTEFDGRGGQLISMGLAAETGKSMYVVMLYEQVRNPWVTRCVVPHLFDVPHDKIDGPLIYGASPKDLYRALEDFLRSDTLPHFVADGEQDIMYLCDALVGPEYVPDRACWDMKFSVKRVDAYPTALKGAVQHNAWWDAMALRTYFVGPEYE